MAEKKNIVIIPKHITPLSVYANRVGIPERELLGRSRIGNTAIARECYWFAMHKHKITYKSIAARFRRNSHATIISGVQNINDLIDIKHKQTLKYIEALNIIIEN